ncbi:hypothetical protein KZZ52_50105 [Dactylosporangium sp. AC04546]|uniref:hypothetical protein n=1 Tax=Dactylosporangium sp. AC04546 TaxID=2862460 RepID=UPI001EDDCDEB|nr:hypothetical protein [Dactylosporangium sp. AC04546]WVK82034.1 hypothetical protein KZZ52_50105 [Dactylosporangium sp. AC04546]
MSDYETGDAGHDPSSYEHYEAGAESGELEQLHTAEGSQADYQSDFNVYEQDTESAESTDFQQGSSVQFDSPDGTHYEEQNFTNYSNDSYDSNHIFAAEGSEESHQSQFAELDALRQEFDSKFAEGTVIEGNPSAELGPAS